MSTKWLLFFAAFAVPSAAFCSTVKIRTISEVPPPTGVRSKIYLKTPTNAIQVIETDENGELTLTCDKNVQVKAIPVDNTSYLFDDGWLPCSKGKEIVIRFSVATLTVGALSILNGQSPVGIPPEYEDASKQIKAYVDSTQWGAAAKISSQISSQLRKAGMFEKANIYGEVSMYTTLVGAFQSSKGDQSQKFSTVFEPNSKDAWPKYSPEAQEVLFKYQETCNVVKTGKADWKTMSCLTGGQNFKLPSSTLKSPQS